LEGNERKSENERAVGQTTLITSPKQGAKGRAKPPPCTTSYGVCGQGAKLYGPGGAKGIAGRGAPGTGGGKERKGAFPGSGILPIFADTLKGRQQREKK